MRIERAHIFGFGKWIDESFSFQDESFVCFYGKNEAGKSTLQQFFLYMLFGLPPRKLARFKPKYSSQIGGTLTVHFPEVGEVTIERVESDFRLFLPDGEIEEDEAFLQAQLNDLQASTYRAIYGFSSLDLFQLHQMKQQQLSDLLFSVSLTGSTAVYELERKFTRRLDELFKRAGRRPKINEQITKVKELEKNLHKTKREVLSYREKLAERTQCEAALATVETKLTNDMATYHLQEKIVQFLPQIRSFLRVTEELKQLREKQLTFPENGIDRYEQLQQQLVPIKAEQQRLEQTIAEYKQALNDQEAQLLRPEQAKQLKQLHEQRPLIENKEQTLASLRTSIDHIQKEIDDYVARLQIEEGDVVQFQPPFHATSTWKALIDESTNLQYEGERLEEQADVLEQKRQSLQSEKVALESRFIGFQRLQERQANEANRSEQMQQFYAKQTLHEWKQNRANQMKNSTYVTGIITIIFLSVYFFQQTSSLLLFSAAFFMMTLIQMRNRRKLTMKLSRLTKELKELTYRTSEEDARTSLQAQEKIAKQLTHINESLKAIQIEQLQWEEKNNHFALKEQKWVSAVELEREKLPLLQQVELEYWIELLHHIEKIKTLQKERDELQTKESKIERTVTEFKETIEQIGRDIAPEETSFTSEEVEQALKTNESLQEQSKQYRKLKDEAMKQRASLQEEQKVIQQQINELFHLTNVEDDESFYQTARLIEEQLRLQTSYDALNDQLQAVFSKDTLQTILAEPIDELQVEQRIKKLEQSINEAEEKREKLQQQVTTLQIEIEQLESSDDYSYATHMYERERDRLNALAEEWIEVKVAQAILEEAKWSYQQKYITDVLTYTSNYFMYLTKERYMTVYPPTEKNSFQVEARNKMRYTVEELSKGTIDQLYVALRFAISKVMSEKFVVPLMIDDAFIHFDEERAALAVQLLEKMATDQQVILYTCQRHVAQSVNQTNSLRIDL